MLYPLLKAGEVLNIIVELSISPNISMFVSIYFDDLFVTYMLIIVNLVDKLTLLSNIMSFVSLNTF